MTQKKTTHRLARGLSLRWKERIDIKMPLKRGRSFSLRGWPALERAYAKRRGFDKPWRSRLNRKKDDELTPGELTSGHSRMILALKNSMVRRCSVRQQGPFRRRSRARHTEYACYDIEEQVTAHGVCLLLSMQHQGENALATARHLGRLDLADTKQEDVIYTSILNRTVVSYSKAWILPLAFLALTLFLSLVITCVRRAEIRLADLAAGAGVVFVAIAASLIAIGILFLLGTAWSALRDVSKGPSIPWFKYDVLQLQVEHVS